MGRFLKSVALGALAAAAMPMILTSYVAAIMLSAESNGHFTAWQGAYLAILPLLVTFPTVLLASTLIGLPTAAFLRWRNWESREAYVFIGTLAGALIPAVWIFVAVRPGAYWIALLGAFGGGVTAHAWWRSRAPNPKLAPSTTRSTAGGPPPPIHG